MNRYDIRRLEKAAREKNIEYLIEWGNNFEQQLSIEMKKQYEKQLRKEFNSMLENLLISVAYTLHFSEETKLNKESTKSFIDDLYSTLDLFRTGEYNADEYKELLEKDGVNIPFDYDYSKVYEEKQKELDQLINEYKIKLKGE